MGRQQVTERRRTMGRDGADGATDDRTTGRQDDDGRRANFNALETELKNTAFCLDVLDSSVVVLFQSFIVKRMFFQNMSDRNTQHEHFRQYISKRLLT